MLGVWIVAPQISRVLPLNGFVYRGGGVSVSSMPVSVSVSVHNAVDVYDEKHVDDRHTHESPARVHKHTQSHPSHAQKDHTEKKKGDSTSEIEDLLSRKSGLRKARRPDQVHAPPSSSLVAKSTPTIPLTPSQPSSTTSTRVEGRCVLRASNGPLQIRRALAQADSHC